MVVRGALVAVVLALAGVACAAGASADQFPESVLPANHALIGYSNIDVPVVGNLADGGMFVDSLANLLEFKGKSKEELMESDKFWNTLKGSSVVSSFLVRQKTEHAFTFLNDFGVQKYEEELVDAGMDQDKAHDCCETLKKALNELGRLEMGTYVFLGPEKSVINANPATGEPTTEGKSVRCTHQDDFHKANVNMFLVDGKAMKLKSAVAERTAQLLHDAGASSTKTVAVAASTNNANNANSAPQGKDPAAAQQAKGALLV